MRQLVLQAQEHAREVGGKDAVPERLVVLVHRGIGVGVLPRVVDGDVQRSIVLDRACDQGLHLG